MISAVDEATRIVALEQGSFMTTSKFGVKVFESTLAVRI